MGITMNEKKLKALANELAKDLKTPEDLSALTAQLTKITVEAALNAELDHHLGYTQYEHRGHHTGNSRNGYSTKTLKGDHGEIEHGIATPASSLKPFKSHCQSTRSKKGSMANPAEAVEKTTGYVLGGISPLGQKKRLPFIIDKTVNEF